MPKSEELEDILSELTENADIQGGAVASRDGLLMASKLPGDMNEESIAAMAAAIVGTAETSTEELDMGNFNQVIVKASEAQYVSIGAGKEAILMCLLKSESNLGLVLMEMNRAARKINRLLG